MKKVKPFLCMILTGSLLFLSACGGGGGNSPELSGQGRYVEKDITPPIDGRFVSFLTVDDTLVCFSEDLTVRYDSTDGGESWSQKPGFDGVSGNILAGTLLEDGRALVYIQEEGLFLLSTEGGSEPFSVPEIDEAIASGENIMISLLQALQNDRLLLGYMIGGMMSQVSNDDGESAPTGGEGSAGGSFEAPTEGSTENVTENRPEGGGPGSSSNTFTGRMENKTMLYDLAARESIADLSSENISTATGDESNLYLMDLDGNVSTYNLVDGASAGREKISFSSGVSARMGFMSMIGGISSGSTLAIDKQGRLYAVMNSSLLVSDSGGNVSTALESTAYSIGAPSSSVNAVLVLDDGSIVLNLQDNGETNHLYKYVWDENATTDPDKTISVWSLEDNSFVRAAIAELRKKNPDSHISYEVALSDDSGMSAADAIKTLNTRLLNGSGPDVVILDGIPLESYEGTGMLLDLSAMVDTGDVYENLLTPYVKDGKFYCLPTQFYMPALMGSAESLAKAQSLDDLVSLVVNGKDLPANNTSPGSNPFSGVAEEERAELYFEDLGELCKLLWLTCSPEIVSENKLDTDALRTYLEAVKAISDKYGLAETQEGEGGGRISMAFAGGGGVAMELSGSLIRYAMQVTNYGAFTAGNLQLLQMMMERAGSELALFPGLSSGVWQPSTVAGISADTKVPEFAAQLLSVMLSLDVQKLNYGEGLPVTRSGIAAQIDSINEQRAENGSSAFELDADALIARLQTPSMRDETLIGMAWGSVEKYCRGQTDIEGAVKEIEQNVKNYLAERT